MYSIGRILSDGSAVMNEDKDDPSLRDMHKFFDILLRFPCEVQVMICQVAFYAESFPPSYQIQKMCKDILVDLEQGSQSHQLD